MSETKRDYQVGRGKPSVDSRFKKGQSGDPRGPRRKNLPALLVDALNEKVVATIYGQPARSPSARRSRALVSHFRACFRRAAGSAKVVAETIDGIQFMAALSRLLLLIAALTFGGTAMAADLENTLYMDVPAGRVVIEMRPDLAPATCAQIKSLVRQGFYDGIVFHRVIDGFMAQTGDPKGDGTGGSGHPLKAEFSNEKHVRGTVSMARTSDPNSADSQFFIMFAPNPSLDGKYTIWGMVVSGMDNIDKIKKGDPARNGAVSSPDKIIRMQVAADAEKAKS